MITYYRKQLKILLLSTPVGAIGSGIGGGVELILYNLSQEMIRRGHSLQVVAPKGSVLNNIPIVEIGEQLQISVQTQDRNSSIIMPENSVLANMWEYARQVQHNYDLIFNLAYDWLPFYLTPFFNQAIAHLVSMSSLTNIMDDIIEQIAIKFPKTVGCLSVTQAETFAFAEKLFCINMGIDLSQYKLCHQPSEYLAWVGRIAPEKGLEDAVIVAKNTGIPLKIMGKIQDKQYWEYLRNKYPDAPLKYIGFLSTSALQKQLGECRGLLMTHSWVEAFGNVAIEALACGVPVISYRRGGPAKIIKHEQTGFLVEPNRPEELIKAINKLSQIDRQACRQQVELEYSLEAMGDSVEKWFWHILRSHAIQKNK